jgi:TonB-dependent receptor
MLTIRLKDRGRLAQPVTIGSFVSRSNFQFQHQCQLSCASGEVVMNKYQGGNMRIYTFFDRCKISCVIILASLFSFSSLFAQGSGTMKGRVVDSGTGEALPGAVVLLQPTTLGAATDQQGNFKILNIPAGTYTARISFLGYAAQTQAVTIAADAVVERIFRLKMQAIEGEEVVVTAQALGQDVAINKQLSSRNVVNVVSAARIQELPDANAAESVGRLPGVSLVRSGGQATQVVIRGLQPQYNTVSVNGVPIAANDAGSISTSGAYATPTNNAGGRSVDMSMISSSSLEGIEVYKTVTPDMDAAVLGGTVNFSIREAEATTTGVPLVSLLAQGAYNNLMSTYDDYKFVASIENRFFDDRLGVFVQGIAQRQNLTSNQLGGSYYQPNKQDKPDSIVLGSMNLAFSPREVRRYDGTLSLDYRLPNGKITLVNLLSHGKTTNESHSETYNLATFGNDIQFGTQMSTSELNVISSILGFEQTLGSIKLNVKLSNAYSDNLTPSGWNVVFDQLSAGTGTIPNYKDPVQIANLAEQLINLDNMIWQGNSTWKSFNKQDDMQAAIDLESNLNLSDLVSVTLKGGGSYRYTTRYYNFDDGYGSLYSGAATGFRLSLVRALPWLTQPPYNFDPTGNQYFRVSGFYDPAMNFGRFLKGQYGMHSAVRADLINTVMDAIRALGQAATQSQTVPSYLPDMYGSVASDYSGNEFRSAEYLMGTINIGPQLSIIAGVRYQGLKTSYTAAHFMGNADATNPYPQELLHTMETQDEYHGYWLPHATVKCDPFEWLSVRGSYSSTLAYPDFAQIVPRLDVSSNSGHYVVWNNYELKPARSQNYDCQVALHENSVGYFAVTPFLKRIYDQLFSQATYIADPSQYPGVPSYTKTFSLTTFVNNPNRVDIWGIEAEWQTHFWYLPGPLSGLVLNVNYTHIFSSAEYPYNITLHSPVYPFPTTHLDTTYTDRLIQQPNDIVNLSLGFDYGKFSILASMIYQSEVYNGTNFYNSLRSDKARYLRWDVSVKQGLPWNGLEAFFDVNNINSEEDSYTIRGSGFPTSESNYGLSADLGIRWRID